MRWMLLGLFLLLITPLRVGAAARWTGHAPTLTVGVTVWGVRAQTEICFRRDEAGALLLTAGIGKKAIPLRLPGENAGNGLKALALLLRSNADRAMLRNAVRVSALDVFLQIGGQNAAFIALAAGFLQALNPLLPQANLVCRPSFGGETKAYLRCIAEARLGILLAAWLRWRKERRAGQKEEKHGASYRKLNADDA